MRKLFGLLCVMLACSPAMAQDKSKDPDKKAPLTPPLMPPEQKKQAIATECKKEAAALTLKDEALKTFLSSCLKN